MTSRASRKSDYQAVDPDLTAETLLDPTLIDEAYDTHENKDHIEQFEMEEDPLDRIPSKQTNRTKAAICIVLWCVFSISLSVYNKMLFSNQGADFKFPLITTSFHQVIQILLSIISLYFLKLTVSIGGANRLKTIPPAIASALDMGLSNTSLLFVSLSFYTMIKSSSLGFVLLFSILFKLEVLTWKLGSIIGVMTVGVVLMAVGEVHFSVLGFLFVLFGAASSGVRWALVKLFLNGGTAHVDPSKKPHPVQTILAFSPFMAVILFVWGSIMEGLPSFGKSQFWKTYPVWQGILVVMFPGCLAYAMTVSEYVLLDTTGPVTMAIVGVLKEIMSIGASMLIFGDKLSAVNILGLVVTLASIGTYNYYKMHDS